jgi:hypothetical protein
MTMAMTETRAARLDALCAKVAPGAKYTIFTPEAGGTARRITIEDQATGDRIGAVGATIDEALDNLAAKIK